MTKTNDAARADDAWISEVYGFWFEELEPEQWFRADPAVDEAIRRRFAALHRSLAAREPAAPSPRAAVASVIALDQFPRNIYRRTADAYATDGVALETAQAAIAAGFDRELSAAERQFLYMPFQHSEDRLMQQRSVELFASIGDAEGLRYAIEHQRVIDRFGRFPHRNAILGRPSTPEELEFMNAEQGPRWAKL
jgi:uncharacterized protein (DUF924 family)